MSYQPRFATGIYRDCKWCRGKGCLSCPAEAKKEYQRQFPDGPKPILTIKREEFDALEIAELTGGAGMRETHGDLGVLCAAVFEHLKSLANDKVVAPPPQDSDSK